MQKMLMFYINRMALLIIANVLFMLLSCSMLHNLTLGKSIAKQVYLSPEEKAILGSTVNGSISSISDYNRALANDPNNVTALFGKAVALADLGRFDEAISYYDKVLAIDPNHWWMA